jgi:hypothetical protein
MQASSRHLIFHGAIVLLFGLVLGAPYARAIKRNATQQVINSWRVAHQSLPIGAVLMFSIAALLPYLNISVQVAWAIAITLIISSYAFCISTPLAAITRDRGLTSGAVGFARFVYLGNIVGALSSLVGAAMFLIAAFVSL